MDLCPTVEKPANYYCINSQSIPLNLLIETITVFPKY